MNILDNLAQGLAIAVEWRHLLWLLAGCVLGCLAAAMPRLGKLAVLAMLLPVARKLELMQSMSLLVGIYCGGQASMLAVAATASQAGRAQAPEAASIAPVVTPLPAAPALLVLVAGLVGSLWIAAIAPFFIEQAFRFGPAEYFSLVACGLVASVVFAPGSLLKALSMLVLGLMLAQISTDPTSSAVRFGFDLAELEPGLGLIPLAMGVVTIARVIALPRSPDSASAVPPAAVRAAPGFDLRRHWQALLRGSAVGSLFGLVPGGGPRLSAYVVSAADDKIMASQRSEAGPRDSTSAQAAVVAAGRSSFLPLLALGFPVNAAMALIAGSMLNQGIEIGPQLMTGQPNLFWGVVAATLLASVLLYLAGSPLAWLSRRAGVVESSWLPAVVVSLCIVGAYTWRGSGFDVVVMAGFGLVGHLFFRLGCPLAPLLLAFVLGPAMEQNLRHALELSAGDWGTLISRPISASLLLVAAGLVVTLLLPSLRTRRARIFGRHG